MTELKRLMALVRRYAAAHVSSQMAYARDAYPPTLKRFDDQEKALSAELERELTKLVEQGSSARIAAFLRARAAELDPSLDDHAATLTRAADDIDAGVWRQP